MLNENKSKKKDMEMKTKIVKAKVFSNKIKYTCTLEECNQKILESLVDILLIADAK